MYILNAIRSPGKKKQNIRPSVSCAFPQLFCFDKYLLVCHLLKIHDFTKRKKKIWSIKYTLFIAEVSCYFHISFWNLLLSASGLDVCLYICFSIILIENMATIVKYSNCTQASDYMSETELVLWAYTNSLFPLQPIRGGIFTWNERSQRLSVGVHGGSCRKVWDEMIYNLCT